MLDWGGWGLVDSGNWAAIWMGDVIVMPKKGELSIKVTSKEKGGVYFLLDTGSDKTGSEN